MKTPYQNIYSVLKLNRFVVIAVVICAFSSSIFSGWIAFSINKRALNSAFAVNTNGEVIPLKLISQKENFRVEALAHLELFHNYFYNIDASNYEKNLEKALWLGNSSVDNLYRQKKADGVYNRLIQYSLVQKVLSINSEVEEQEEKYSFKTTTIFEINRGQMYRSFTLEHEVDETKVEAKYQDGILELSLPKRADRTGQKIEIH